ncbi:MAG: ABC transporter permease [Eubacteriales bacterium]
MNEIIHSIVEGFKLIISFDKEVMGIISLSLAVSFSSTFFSALIGVPFGVLLGSRDFKGRRMLIRLVNTFMGFPPVIAGLVVYLFLTRKGLLGPLELLYSPTAMVMAQVLIVFPIITGFTLASVKLKANPIMETCKGLGLNDFSIMKMIFKECKYSIISALMAGYGRAISEVGAIMIVGGNIQYHTRVMTSAIVLETGKGNYDIALALGMILLSLSFIINWVSHVVQEAI